MSHPQHLFSHICLLLSSFVPGWLALVPTTLNYTRVPYALMPSNFPFPFSKPFSIPAPRCLLGDSVPPRGPSSRKTDPQQMSGGTTPLAFAPSEFWVVPSISFLSNNFETCWVWSHYLILHVFCLAHCPIPLSSTVTEETCQTMYSTIVKSRVVLEHPVCRTFTVTR